MTNLKDFWQNQLPIYNKIKAQGFSQYINSLPNIKSAFRLSDYSLRCIDEGTPGGIHLAGSGILLSEDKAESIIDLAKIDGIYSHAECGAAKLFAKEKNLDSTRSDEYGIDWAKKIAAKLNLPYKGHIKITEIARPSGFHIARATYYDGSGNFNPDKVAGLPLGFVISRKYLNPEYALKEAEIAISIALGDHGFGGLITSEEPFYLVPIGDSNKVNLSLKKLTDELKPLAEKFNQRVVIDGFKIP